MTQKKFDDAMVLWRKEKQVWYEQKRELQSKLAAQERELEELRGRLSEAVGHCDLHNRDHHHRTPDAFLESARQHLQPQERDDG